MIGSRAVALLTSGIVVCATACGSSSDPDAEPSPENGPTSSAAASPAASAAPTSEAPPGGIDASFDVGGHELHLGCSGEEVPGTPTMVYLHGLGGGGDDVHEALSGDLVERGHLCTYDRVNVGSSDRQSTRHLGTDSVADLHALLTAAEVEPPYLLVGFSFGGLIATMYAGTHPADVAGILLLDSSLPTDGDVDALIPEPERQQVMADQEANGEQVDFYDTLVQAEGLLAAVPDVPITYLAARPVSLPAQWPVKRMRSLIETSQQAFVDGFRQGRLVPVQSSHDVDLDRPEVVIEELDRLLGLV